MLALRKLATRPAFGARCLSAAASQAAPAADQSHAEWLKTVSSYPVRIPKFEWTLEWALPSPVPLHQFTQSPLVIEVTDRNKNSDDLIYKGPDVVGGYTHPETGAKVTRQEHDAVIQKLGTGFDKGYTVTLSDHGHHHH